MSSMTDTRRRRPMVGPQIRHRRRERGLTLAAVADATGLNVGYLSQVENDKASPSLRLSQRSPTRWTCPSRGSSSSRASRRGSCARPNGRCRTRPWLAGRCRAWTAAWRAMSRSSRATMPAGVRTGFHAHPGDEHHIVLEGTLRITQGETWWTPDRVTTSCSTEPCPTTRRFSARRGAPHHRVPPRLGHSELTRTDWADRQRAGVTVNGPHTTNAVSSRFIPPPNATRSPSRATTAPEGSTSSRVSPSRTT